MKDYTDNLHYHIKTIKNTLDYLNRNRTGSYTDELIHDLIKVVRDLKRIKEAN